MLRDVSTDNGSLFHKKGRVIFYDDYVQYDNSSLFFRAVIDCCMYSMVHSVLVDSCKIIWDFYCSVSSGEPPATECGVSVAKEVYIPSLQFTFLRLCSSLKSFPFRHTHKVQLSLLSKIFPCSLNSILFPEQFILMQLYELSAISENPNVQHLRRKMPILRHYLGQ